MSDEMKSIIEEMKELTRHEIIDVDGATLALLPEGRRIESLQPYIDALLDAPKRIRGTVPLSTVSALIDYMNRFKRPDSVVFASDAGGNGASPQLVGIVGFYGPGPAAQPAFGGHPATFLFPRSDQMAAWSAVSGKGMSHDEFASFLQERQYDIVNPPLDWMAVDPKTIELLLHLLNISDDYGATDATLDRPAGKSGMTARDHRDGAGDEVVEPPDDRYMPRSALYKLRAIRWGTAQRLQQLARTLEVSVNSVATEGYSPKTGERTIKFVEEHTTRDA